jgi:hypothetical protein
MYHSERTQPPFGRNPDSPWNLHRRIDHAGRFAHELAQMGDLAAAESEMARQRELIQQLEARQ